MELDILIEEWAEAGFSDEKLTELKQRHPDVDWLELAGRIMQATGQMEPRFQVTQEALWNRIEDQVEGRVVEEVQEEEVAPRPQGQIRRFRGRRWLYLAAAVILLAVVFIVVPGSTAQTRSTFAGETLGIRMPDGSEVTLAANSELTWDEGKWEEKRKLELEGEAFFEVKPGAEFRVTAGPADVVVLGTSFNIRLRDDVLDVACRTGAVEVRSAARSARLLPGDTWRIDARGREAGGKADPANIGAWRTGMFYYKDTPLRQVFDEVERQFGYAVKTAESSIDKLMCNGFFSTDEIDAAMTLLCKPLGLKYDIDTQNKTVTVQMAP